MKGKPIEPGCLALIVGARSCKENIGRTVRVLRKPKNPYEVTPGSSVDFNSQPWSERAWFIESLPGHPLLASAVVGSISRELKRKEMLRVICVSEKNLIRLDDDDENLDRVVEQSKPAITAKPIEEIF